MLTETAPEILQGIVEVDETWVGGKISNKHKSKWNIGRNDNKTMVFGFVERQDIVTTQIVANTTSESPINVVKETIQEGTIMVTVEHLGYNKLNKLYKHVKVKHSKEEYVMDTAHTNTIEGFWSLLKSKSGVFITAYLHSIYSVIAMKHLSDINIKE